MTGTTLHHLGGQLCLEVCQGVQRHLRASMRMWRVVRRHVASPGASTGEAPGAVTATQPPATPFVKCESSQGPEQSAALDAEAPPAATQGPSAEEETSVRAPLQRAAYWKWKEQHVSEGLPVADPITLAESEVDWGDEPDDQAQGDGGGGAEGPATTEQSETPEVVSENQSPSLPPLTRF